MEIPTAGLPSKVVQFHNPCSQRPAGFAGCRASNSTVNAFAIVVVAKLQEIPFEIKRADVHESFDGSHCSDVDEHCRLGCGRQRHERWALVRRRLPRCGDWSGSVQRVYSRILDDAPDLPSVKSNMETLHRRGVEKVDVFSLMLIPGTELYSKESRSRFGMKTMHRLAQGCIIDVEGEVISETEELAVENDALSFEDFFDTQQVLGPVGFLAPQRHG